MGKTQKAQQIYYNNMTLITKLVVIWHLLQNLLLHNTHYKACCYTTFTKLIATRHPLQSLIVTRHALQSLLLHNTLYKTYWYTTPYKAQKKHLAIFIEAYVCTWQYFIKSQNIIKSPKYYFGNILQKNAILLWQHFIKNPKLLIFGQTIILSKPKYYLAKILYYAQSPKLIIFGTTYFDILNSLANMQTHGKHKLFTTYLFYKI